LGTTADVIRTTLRRERAKREKPKATTSVVSPTEDDSA
jgi:hypothetical protein